MERLPLDLRLSVYAGTSASVGNLVLFCHLRAHPRNRRRSPPEVLVLCREASCPPAGISKFAVSDQDLARLERLLRAAGFPERVPRIVPNRSPLGEGQYVALEVRIHRQIVACDFLLEYAGFAGEDAQPIRAMLRLLAELAETAGRPSVQAVVDRLVRDRGRREAPERSWESFSAVGCQENGSLAAISAGLALGAAISNGDPKPRRTYP
jgi:hypothetical protein